MVNGQQIDYEFNQHNWQWPVGFLRHSCRFQMKRRNLLVFLSLSDGTYYTRMLQIWRAPISRNLKESIDFVNFTWSRDWDRLAPDVVGCWASIFGSGLYLDRDPALRVFDQWEVIILTIWGSFDGHWLTLDNDYWPFHTDPVIVTI